MERISFKRIGISGEKVGTIINKELSAGYYTIEVNASELNLATGMYLYRMSVSSNAG